VNARILVAGVGNIFLGDDGFGSQVASVLSARSLPDGVRVVDYGIRGMHLAYDLLDGYDALVLVDAVARGDDAGDITVLEVGADDLGGGEFDAHGMDPVAVLASLGSLGGELPRTIVVGCRAANVEDGIGLSPAVEAAVDPAADLVIDLLESLTSADPVAASSREDV
jgi:hydrogenase maturation protease